MDRPQRKVDEKMLKKILLLVIIVQNAQSALRKSWKSPANFEADVPKFTPFESVVNEQAEPEAPTKISSKVKASVINTDSDKVSHDFGSFAYQTPETSSEEKGISNEVPSKLLNTKIPEETDEEDEESEFEFFSNDEGSEYKIGKVMNVSVDSNDEIVNVNLDQHSLKDLFTGNKRGNF